VHPAGGSLRVFRHFAGLQVDSVKAALPHPTHQRVTQTVGQFALELIYFYIRLLYNDFVPFITNS
jgi:hypothetical protein